MNSIFNEAVCKNRDLILKTLDYIWTNPETGYREIKTSKHMADTFKKLGYELHLAENIPGFYTVLDTGRPGPEILILGELDSLICGEHPDADPETSAVHCCGHAAQCAALVGVAAALKEPGVLEDLCGRIRLCAVPAEELIEIEYRTQLKKDGVINYLEGKPEFLSRGYFDGVDIAFMVHTSGGTSFSCELGAVGAISKKITYKGVSAHAGGAPWEGRNALYAASLGLSAINAIRETFKEDDMIRVHPVITNGGGAVNAIPDKVVLESYIRGKTFDGIKAANERVNRALIGAALSLGVNIDIEDIPAFAPLINDPNMIDVFEDAAACIPGIPCEKHEVFWSASTDMGDLSCIMPVIHPYAPGSSGTIHGIDYKIADPDLACVASAKLQLNMLYLLLKDGAERANRIITDFKPRFNSKEEYLAYIDGFNASGDRITYSGNERADIKL